MSKVEGKGQLIEEIQDKIQFAITAAIFFITFVYGFYKAIGTDDIHSNKIALTWGVGVAFYIADYLAMNWVGGYIGKKWLTVIEAFLSVGIAAFVPLILILAAISNKAIQGYWKWPFLISLQASLWMPIAVFAIVILHFDWMAIREPLKGLLKILKVFWRKQN